MKDHHHNHGSDHHARDGHAPHTHHGSEGGHGPVEHGAAADWRAAVDDAARLRVVIDQVASLTDASALAVYERLVGSLPSLW